ncbi:MAG: alpha-ketoglutarate-dependent dioxygenase AlkB family protein [Luteolibacter sp.]
MELFPPEPERNLLPFDGEVFYFGVIFPADVVGGYRRRLMEEVPWESDEVVMFGKRIVTARKVAWYADGGISYQYSGTKKVGLDWSPVLLEIKERVEGVTGASYNSCLLNLYHHGGEGMGWHSDDEKSLEEEASIASVSFGAERKFSFKHRATKETVGMTLDDGSVLEMKGKTQAKWWHQLPKTKKVGDPRINLTFRKMKWG